MMNNLVPILGLSFLGSVAGLLGGIVFIWKQNLAKKLSTHLIAFAAGVMISAAFLDLLPEAHKRGGENAFLIALIGLVCFFLLEDFILHFHHHEGHSHSLKSIVPLIMISDSIHNFIDGAVIATSFLVDPKLGFIVSIATFFHEIPQEVGDFGVLLASGVSKSKVIIANLISACATFVGAILTVFFASTTQNLLGPLLGLATGMFLYIASADILPQLVHGEDKKIRWHIAGFFLAGIFLIYFVTRYE